MHRMNLNLGDSSRREPSTMSERAGKVGRFLAALGLIIAAADRADAGMLYYTETLTATGSVGQDRTHPGVGFTNASIAISVGYDTTKVTGSSGNYLSALSTGTITIAGLGTYALSTQVQISSGLFLGLTNGAGVSYLQVFSSGPINSDLTTAIGPIASPSIVSTIAGNGLLSPSAGAIVFLTAGPGVASVSTVPEPSSIVLCGLAGLTGLTAARARRRRSAA